MTITIPSGRTLPLQAKAGGGFESAIVSADVIVFDDFESGDFSSPGYPEFQWLGDITDPAQISTTDSISGTTSMLFRYLAGSNWVEKRFEILRTGVDDLWISWWLRIPTNFYHNLRDGGALAGNNKLIRIGQGEDDGSTTPFTDAGGMEFRPYWEKTGVDNGESFMYLWPGSGDSEFAEFARLPRDLGRWMHIAFHVRTESSPGAADGIREAYRKWQGDADYTFVGSTGLYSEPYNGGFRYGYLMGYHNSAYAEDTDFLIDDLKFSTVRPEGVPA